MHANFIFNWLFNLWAGALPNMGRNAIVNVAEIVCYDVVKEKIIKSGLLDDNIPCHFTSAVISGNIIDPETNLQVWNIGFKSR